MHVIAAAHTGVPVAQSALLLHVKRHDGSQPLPLVLCPVSQSSPGSTVPLPQVHRIAALQVSPVAHDAPTFIALHGFDPSTDTSPRSLASDCASSPESTA
jgi:hypothetical protein